MGTPNRWFLAACLATALVAFMPVPAQCQDVDPKQVEAIVQALQQANASSGGTFDWGPVAAAVLGVLGLFGGLHRYAPQMGSAGRDPVLEERTRESRREIRRLRERVHWHAQCLTALADKVDVELPEKRKVEEESDSDQEQP